MSNTVQSRIFQLLSDLIPNLGGKESRTHFAPPRIPGDMAVHCTIDGQVTGISRWKSRMTRRTRAATHSHGSVSTWTRPAARHA